MGGAVGHPPLPSQKICGVRVLPLTGQICPRQAFPLDQGRQAPAPLHVPSLEQSPAPALLLLQRDFVSEPPLSTLEQVPGVLVVVPLQVLHRPPEVASAQALLQHNPSVQNPLWHWLAAVQAAPFPFLPHVVTPFVNTQVAGATQSESAVQVFLHALEVQMKGSHLISAGVAQVPAPSQVEVGVATDALAQTADLHLRPLAE